MDTSPAPSTSRRGLLARWPIGVVCVGLLLGGTSCLGFQESLADLRADFSGSFAEMDQAAQDREAALREELAHLDEARVRGAVTPEGYGEELRRLLDADMAGQYAEVRELGSSVKQDLEDFGRDIETQLKAAREKGVSWGQMLAGLAGTLLTGGGLAGGLAQAARNKAQAHADYVAAAEAQSAADALDRARDERRMMRGERLYEAPQAPPVAHVTPQPPPGYQIVPIVPVPMHSGALAPTNMPAQDQAPMVAATPPASAQAPVPANVRQA